jgi:NADH-quinone oxidoreductase subunit G
VQLAERVVFPKGDARDDWAVLRALSERLGAKLPYDTLADLRAKLMADHPTFGQVDYVPGPAGAPGFNLSKLGEKGEVSDAPFASPIKDFYLTNPIARASVTMAECSAARTLAPALAAE